MLQKKLMISLINQKKGEKLLKLVLNIKTVLMNLMILLKIKLNK